MTIWKRTLLAAAVLTGLVSCAQETELYSLAGTAFCVPTSLAIHAPNWVPPDPPNSPDAFAFQGCATDKHPCPLPQLVAGSVTASPMTHVWRLKDFPSDAQYRMLAEAPDTDLKASLPGGIVVLQNTKMDSQWVIWHKATATGSRPLAANDQLEAICKSGLANPDYLQSTVSTVQCRRLVNRQGLSLRYIFTSKSTVPTNLQELDESVFSTMMSWQCR